MTDYITYNHSVCNINYYFVWCTKYRKEVLVFTNELKAIFEEICQKYQWTIMAIEIITDHIHIFISIPPFDAPSKIAKLLKGISARKIFQLFPYLREGIWESHLWSPSYYCGTASVISSAVIQKYIASQKNQSSTGNSSPD